MSNKENKTPPKIHEDEDHNPDEDYQEFLQNSAKNFNYIRPKSELYHKKVIVMSSKLKKY